LSPDQDVIEMHSLGIHSLAQVKAHSHVDAAGHLVIVVDPHDMITLNDVHSKAASSQPISMSCLDRYDIAPFRQCRPMGDLSNETGHRSNSQVRLRPDPVSSSAKGRPEPRNHKTMQSAQ